MDSLEVKPESVVSRFRKPEEQSIIGEENFDPLKGGYKANYYDVETGDPYWISGPRKDGADELYGKIDRAEIDEDVREEYWRDIRGLSNRNRRTTALPLLIRE